MRPLYDFGISQEDPLTELKVLDIGEDDHVLCIASAGEVPLSILCLRPGVKITAVDISETQLILCRLKMQVALQLPFPLNGQFLGYSQLKSATRRSLYFEKIHPELDKNDQAFWLQNMAAIEKGVVHCGRFEGYINHLRKIASLLIGRKNIRELLLCNGIEEQQAFFDKYIASRKAIKYLFRIAFHPSIYKNRGISSKGLMHAKANTGEIFFNKFRNFCTATPAKVNYFLQYTLSGACTTEEAFPAYLHKNNRCVLSTNKDQLLFKLSSLQEELAVNPPATFSKIHLSNIGDWMSKEDFNSLVDTISNSCNNQTILCYRFLQKNHLDTNNLWSGRYSIVVVNGEQTDRFPFYSILSIKGHA
jgi:S-adenosylmethionine-diacylglycerol 3-amino-3-carboxypropyl transferase